MTITMKSPFNISIGMVITGKWHHNCYTIIKELGRGANGIVYLADWNGKRVAIKISDDHVTITSEVNVLKSFSKAQGVSLGPSLFDVDDWVRNNKKVPFYVMEYIEGKNFLTFIRQNGTVWLPVLISQLLSDLNDLHRQGWVFGDLKPDNLLVTSSPVKMRCIDVGGTTGEGRAIKEFTEFFDRGYWGLGSRRAEPTYDLFAVAMIMINAFYPKRFNKQGDCLTQLKRAIDQNKELKQYKPLLLKAITGKYKSALKMKKELLKLTHSQGKDKNTQQNIVINQQPTKNYSNRSVRHTKTKQKRRKGSRHTLETVFIFSIICIIYVVYIMERLL